MNTEISHHLLLCATSTTQKCCDCSTGKASWEKLKELLSELNLENQSQGKGIILRSKVDCLRICKDGPILLIWPDGIWYQRVTPERVESIIKEHIENGFPIEKWIIKRTPFNNQKHLQ